MKKVLFLLVSLLGFVGQAGAESFTAANTVTVPGALSKKILYVDNSAGVQTDTFTVKNGSVNAVLTNSSTAKAYVANGADLSKLADVTVTSLGNGKFYATVQSGYSLPLTRNQNTLLVFEAGFFKGDGAVNDRLTMDLNVTTPDYFSLASDANASAGKYSPTTYFWDDENTEKISDKLTVSSNIYKFQIKNLSAYKAIDGVQYVNWNGTNIVINEAYFHTITETSGVAEDWKITIPAGTFRTLHSWNSEMTIYYNVKKHVVFTLDCPDISNVKESFTFKFNNGCVPGPNYLGTEGASLASSISSITVLNKLNGNKYTYTDISNIGIDNYYTVILRDSMLYDDTYATEVVYDVTLNGDFYLNNTHSETATSTLKVFKEIKYGISVALDEKTCSTSRPIVKDVVISYPSGVTGDTVKVIKPFVSDPNEPAIAYIIDDFDHNYRVAVDSLVYTGDNKYDVYMADTLAHNNPHHLVFMDQSILGRSIITLNDKDYTGYLYHNGSEAATIPVYVSRVFEFYNNYKATLYKEFLANGYKNNDVIRTTLNDEVLKHLDNYDEIQLFDSIRATRNAVCLPFTVTYKEIKDNDPNITIKRINTVFEDDGTQYFGLTELKESESVYANRPYVLDYPTAPANLVLSFKNHKLVKPQDMYTDCAGTKVDAMIHSVYVTNYDEQELNTGYPYYNDATNKYWYYIGDKKETVKDSTYYRIQPSTGNLEYYSPSINNNGIWTKNTSGNYVLDKYLSKTVKCNYHQSGSKYVFDTKTTTVRTPIWSWYVASKGNGISYSKFVDVDETTGINNVDSVVAAENNATMFNLAGQRITNAKAGSIVIRNGKKVMVK